MIFHPKWLVIFSYPEAFLPLKTQSSCNKAMNADAVKKTVEEDIEKLIAEIQRLGSKLEDGSYKVTFGVLFNDEKCENMFEALVGTLMAARRRQILTFEGERLLDIHHHKVVIELKPTHPTPPAAH
ncbi:hypothetical protein Ccrd_005925 [Cynara cardunculus var. scolymus]|uniref:Costars domain-containing protein n=1 Tax=Cynara cardunculus var. scolymus TaxID=59895 RepID=A0A103XJT0_CYNCS|nr:hypothetical protein Ccrd_005925 [Cynara cardunculus var. scolymus]